MLDRTLLPSSIVLLVSCTGLKDPEWDTAGQILQGGSEWRDDTDGSGTTTGGTEDGATTDGATEGTASGNEGGDDGGAQGAESGSEGDAPTTDGAGASDDGGVTAGSDVGSGDDAGEPSTGGGESGGDTVGSEGGSDGGSTTGGSDSGVASGVGGWAMLYFNVNAYPELLDTPLLQFSAESRMHAAIDSSWLSYMPSLGSCTVDPARGILGAVGHDMGGSATLSASTAVIPLMRSVPTNDYLAEDVPSSSWVSDAMYGIQFADGRTIENVLRTPGGFDDIGPPILRSAADGAEAFETPLSLSGQTFTWAPAAVGDGLLLSLTAYDPYSYERKTELLCNAPDLGSFTISASMFSMAPLMSAGDVAMVGIWRYRRANSISPVDGSIVEGFAQKGGTGTATLIP